MEELKQLFISCTGLEPEVCTLLAGAGSGRRYYRMQAAGKSLIGVEGESVEENRAFVTLSHHLAACGCPVPKVVSVSDDEMFYLQQDLGDTSLYDALAYCRKSEVWDDDAYRCLSAVLRALAQMQVEGDKNLDYSICYPLPEFDARSIMFDLNYFKYCFLKATGIDFNENSLQNDFEKMSVALLAARPIGFMYRDFQSRNIMLHNDQPYFIDFQGGRRGAVHYDVASFLWQARAAYPADLRERLVDVYIDALKKYYPELSPSEFRRELELFVLFRTLQVLGAYGFRGYFERKTIFLQSIPQAIDNMRDMLHRGIVDAYPYLKKLLQKVCDLPRFGNVEKRTTLCVTVYSFSYKKGLPVDDSGNGGGFVFDCRAIHNPGRYPQYAQLTGLDLPVVQFLEEDGEILTFLSHAYSLVDNAVERYIKRGFTHLQVAFGCTGGQHRSVYSAEAMAKHLHEKYNIELNLIHRERGINNHLKPSCV